MCEKNYNIRLLLLSLNYHNIKKEKKTSIQTKIDIIIP